MLKKHVTLLQSGEEDRRVQVPVRVQRRAICVLAVLLLFTWISGCALWPLHRKGALSAGSSQSTRGAIDASSRRQDRDSSTRSGSAAKTAEKTEQGSSRSAPDKPGTSGSGSKEDDTQTSKKQPSADSDSQDLEPSFQKHDHLKYVSSIKNKAIDRLNKHQNATHAIVCKNQTTDLWSFTVYFKRDRTYSYITYAWDDIDQDWKKIFEADRVPISKWRAHMRYSNQDKECSVLKGVDLPQ